MLSLKPFTKRPNPVLGGVRFLAFFFMTTMMFSVFVAAFPLRLMVRIFPVTFARTFVHAPTHAVHFLRDPRFSPRKVTSVPPHSRRQNTPQSLRKLVLSHSASTGDVGDL